MRTKVRLMKVASIKLTVFVRTKPNPERVEFFKGLYKNDAKVDRMKVTEDGQMEEGRHRLQALVELGIKEIEVEIVPNKSRANLIIAAMGANVGGPLPPTQADLTYTAQQLLNEGLSRPKVQEEMVNSTKLIPKYIRHIIDDALSSLKKQRLNDAIDAMGEGELTLNGAAKKFDVDPITLRTAMTGKKVAVNKLSVGQMTASIATRFGSVNQSTAKLLGKIIDGINDGEISEKTARAVVNQVRKSGKNVLHKLQNWERRIDEAIKSKKGK